MITHTFKLLKRYTGGADEAETKSVFPYPPETKEETKPPWWASAFKGGLRPARLNKLEYALFLKNMPFKKGDIIIHSGKLEEDGSIPDAALWAFYEVIDIQEMHNHVEYISGDPKPLWVKCVDKKGVGFWTNPAWYTVVKPGHYPPKLLHFLEGKPDDTALI